MKTTHTCIIGDSRKMDELKDSSIHLIVTSPPYWQLKDYKIKDQIGFDHSYELLSAPSNDKAEKIDAGHAKASTADKTNTGKV